jgi:TonB-dependent SusC/RagA subfamily outer membrane receptor
MKTFPLVVLFLAIPAAGRSQSVGSLEGHVYDGRTQQPLAGAIVSLVGGQSQTRTDDSGFFRLAPLPRGNVDLRIEREGYAAVIEGAEIGGKSGANFKLFSSATVLDAILVKARAIRDSARDGAKTTAVRPDERRSSLGSSSDLVARVPGAMVFSGGQLGSGASIRLRGLKSIIGNTNPLIYLDGVRISGGEPRSGGGAGAGAGGMFRKYAEPTVLDQLDPMSIDHIEVLPGAAATTLYGTGGANGVILIYTKR